jgi:hypothetical protein
MFEIGVLGRPAAGMIEADMGLPLAVPAYVMTPSCAAKTGTVSDDDGLSE